jgi:hypothetical protein
MRTSLKHLAVVLAAGLLSGGSALAAKVMRPAELTVEDNAKLFSSDAVSKAKNILGALIANTPRELVVATHSEIPAGQKDAYEKAQADAKARGKFFHDWAEKEARHERGVFVLIYFPKDKSERGNVQVLYDKQMAQHGFGDSQATALRERFQTAMGEATKARTDPERSAAADKGLIAAAAYARDHLPKTIEPTAKQTQTAQGEGGGIGKWLCIGLCVLLGAWLVIGLIRAFSGGGGAGGTGAGGGGGGFFTSFLGGLFGAAAGMWMYNQFFGGGASSAHAGDAGTDSSGANDAGAGDWSGGGSSGGDFGGDAGGGDFGGGDFGGGDFGGGDF